MLIFNFHIAFALELISLALGAFLLIWIHAGKKTFGYYLAKVIGYIVVILSAICISHALYTGYEYYSDPNKFISERMATMQKMMPMMQQMKQNIIGTDNHKMMQKQ